MRTRLIRPEFWADELMAEATIPTRLVYIGLWNLCDDAGYFQRKPRQIAAALFPYDDVESREALIVQTLDRLLEMGRIQWLACGAHGIVPTLPRHGAKGGSKAETFLTQHRSICRVSERGRTHPDKSSSGSGSGSGSGSDSGSVPASLADAAIAAGGPVSIFARKGSWVSSSSPGRPGLAVVGEDE